MSYKTPISETAARELGTRRLRVDQIRFFLPDRSRLFCGLAPKLTDSLAYQRKRVKDSEIASFFNHPLTFTLKKSSRSTIMSLRKTPHLYSGSSCAFVCVWESASERRKTGRRGGRKREGAYRGEEGWIYCIAAEKCDRASICLKSERCCSRKDAAAVVALLCLSAPPQLEIRWTWGGGDIWDTCRECNTSPMPPFWNTTAVFPFSGLRLPGPLSFRCSSIHLLRSAHSWF